MSVVKGHYPKRMNKSSASKHISDFLKALLREIYDDLSQDNLPAILIGNRVTSIVTDLGILVRDKKLMDYLYH